MKIFRNPLGALPRHAPPAPLRLPQHGVDVRGITDTIRNALQAAGLGTQHGMLTSVTDTIEQALAGAGLGHRDADAGGPSTLDAESFHVVAPDASERAQERAPSPSQRPAAGTFATHVYSCAEGTREYKLYVPAARADAPDERRALVVMLHGCTQSPDDFAAGTRMNELAERNGFLVAYPAQAPHANGSKCWNWFRAEDQQRDRGEPSVLAGITREVAGAHGVDPRRIFVAGLSAGGAMAVVLATTYPEIYAAVGVHSGLPYGAAHDMASAFGAMKRPLAAVPASPAPGAREGAADATVPTIVFHGNGDQTVHFRNGVDIAGRAAERHAQNTPLRKTVQEGTSAGGRRYSRIVYADGADRPRVEHWVVHGGGHAWSGGSPRGSYTDQAGPDASAEMVRFFNAQAPAGTA
ncbi:MAG TPA: PHB depolymerase family esterase [Casimicrobiaceae bacterium]|nr:PHB depolymerase family esterase [Casimicrobiaceae bacterium]